MVSAWTNIFRSGGTLNDFMTRCLPGRISLGLGRNDEVLCVYKTTDILIRKCLYYVYFAFFAYAVSMKATFTPPGVVFVLRWQLSPTQVKCTCNATPDAKYIPYGFLQPHFLLFLNEG